MFLSKGGLELNKIWSDQARRISEARSSADVFHDAAVRMSSKTGRHQQALNLISGRYHEMSPEQKKSISKIALARTQELQAKHEAVGSLSRDGVRDLRNSFDMLSRTDAGHAYP